MINLTTTPESIIEDFRREPVPPRPRADDINLLLSELRTVITERDRLKLLVTDMARLLGRYLRENETQTRKTER